MYSHEKTATRALARPERLKTDHIALRRLREKSGLTQADMATRLGVKLPTYLSYEYGRTKKVPPKVMAAARNLTIDPAYSYVMALYGDRPMSDIAHEWAQRVDANNAHEFATILGVDRATAYRWFSTNTNTTLSAAELLSYDRRVAREEKLIHDFAKRHPRAAGAAVSAAAPIGDKTTKESGNED